MMRRSRCWALAVVAGFVVGSARGGEETPQATRQYAVAVGFQGRKLARLAAQEWRKFLADFPDDPRRDKARHYLGACLLQDGQLDAAIEEFKGLIASSPGYDQLDAVYLNLGVARFRRGREKKSADDVKEASQAFASLIEKFPKSPQVPRALYNQAEAAYQAGKPSEAADGYARLIREHPASELAADARYALGVAQEQLKRPEQAAATFAEFLAKSPNHPLATEARLREAESAFALKKLVEAEALFKQASEAKDFPFADYALLRRAGCLVEQGKPAEAATLYQSLPQRFAASPYAGAAVLAAGQCLFLQGQYGKARELLGKAAARKGPEAAEAAYWSGRCLLKERKPDEAIKTFEAALAASPPAQAKRLLLLGRADATAEVPARLGEAAARYVEFVRSFPDDPQAPQALSQAASSALGAGQVEAAKANAAEFLAKFPKHALAPEAIFVLAESELQARHYPEAAARYRELVEAHPGSPHAEEARVRRGLALSLAKRDEPAIEALNADLPHLKDKALRAHAHYLIGRAQANRKQFEAAIGSLRAALEDKPDWPLADETRLVLAHALRALGRPADASAELARLISGFPRSPVLDQAFFQLGECASEQGRLDEALAAYREALKRAGDGPVAAPARLGIGRSLYRKDDPKGAIEALNALIEKAPGDGVAPRGRYLRALAEHKLKQDPRAIEDLDAFLASGASGDEALDARFLKGICQAASGRQAEAAETFSALLGDQPGYAQASRVEYERAFALKELKRDKDAAEAFRKVAESNASGPLAAESWFRVGEYRYALGEFDEASRAYREGLNRAPDPGLKEKLLHKLAWCAFRRNDFPAAVTAFDRQSAEFPGGPLAQDARFLAAEGDYKQGSWGPALERFRKVVEAKPEAYHARALYRAGQCAGQLKDWSASASSYTDLLAAFPKFAQQSEARYGLGWALQNQGRYPEAIDAYTQVVRETDTEAAAKAQFMIGECLFARKEHAEAARQFLKGAYGYPFEEWAGNGHFEAARCFEVLKQLDQARQSYQVLTTKYPRHPKARLAADRLKELGG